MLKRKKCLIKIYLKPGDKAQIARYAQECDMSMSAYVRLLALGEKPIPYAEIEKMTELMKIHADLGRLGGLLKMTLTNDERLNDMGREMAVATIDGTLVDIRATQAKLLELVDVILNKTQD